MLAQRAMLEAKKQLVKAQTDKDKTYYENKCASLDRQIDRLVYELYGLTPEEIAIVEEAIMQAGPGKLRRGLEAGAHSKLDF